MTAYEVETSDDPRFPWGEVAAQSTAELLATRWVLPVTESGLVALRDKSSARVERMANVLAEDFSRAKLETLYAAAPAHRTTRGAILMATA